jgi:hypothetical protein
MVPAAPQLRHVLRERIAIPLRRFAEVAVFQVEEAVVAFEQAVSGGNQRIRRQRHERRQESQVAGKGIARRHLRRAEMLRHRAYAARDAVGDFCTRHASQAPEIPTGLLHDYR